MLLFFAETLFTVYLIELGKPVTAHVVLVVVFEMKYLTGRFHINIRFDCNMPGTKHTIILKT